MPWVGVDSNKVEAAAYTCITGRYVVVVDDVFIVIDIRSNAMKT
jgi:hypothetical protein